MPKCDKCKCIVPPDMINDEDENKQRLCFFCEGNTTIIFDRKGQRFGKDEVVADYRDYITNLANNENIKKTLTEQIVQTAVNKNT